MLPSNNTSSSSIGAVGHGHKDVIKMEYEDVDSHDAGYRLSNPSMQPVSPHTYMAQHQQPAWNMYPVYYPQAQSSVH
jgi:hypothetical protein